MGKTSLFSRLTNFAPHAILAVMTLAGIVIAILMALSLNLFHSTPAEPSYERTLARQLETQVPGLARCLGGDSLVVFTSSYPGDSHALHGITLYGNKEGPLRVTLPQTVLSNTDTALILTTLISYAQDYVQHCPDKNNHLQAWEAQGYISKEKQW